MSGGRSRPAPPRRTHNAPPSVAGTEARRRSDEGVVDGLIIGTWQFGDHFDHGSNGDVNDLGPWMDDEVGPYVDDAFDDRWD